MTIAEGRAQRGELGPLQRVKTTPRRRSAPRLEGTSGSDRGDIVQEIIAIVSEVAHSLPPGGYDPLDDGMPGG